MTQADSPLRIGTRGSKLALAQANMVRDALLAAHPDTLHPDQIVLETITTTGDRITDRPLAEAGGKGLFTKEIEEALLDGSIDMAVHSMKDMPTELPDGLHIPCILPREDARDAFISRKYDTIHALPAGASVGTASLRRDTIIRFHGDDIQITSLRGNVTTRLEKLNAGEVDAIILAVAGLNRLGLADEITEILQPEYMLPAVAQGAVGIEVRADNTPISTLLAPLHCASTATCIRAERAFLKILDGNCRTPLACYAMLESDDMLWVRGLEMSTDGNKMTEAEVYGHPDKAELLGQQVAQMVNDRKAIV